jgi:hypothetical protein
LAGAGGWPDLTAQLLAVRGYKDVAAAKLFLAADISAAHPPLRLSGMQQAVERLQQAVALRQKVAVLGDYDVDGITSTTLLLRARSLVATRRTGASVSSSTNRKNSCWRTVIISNALQIIKITTSQSVRRDS